MIDGDTGIVHMGHFELRPSTRRASFLENSSALGVSRISSEGKWTAFRIDATPDFIARIDFDGELLKKIELVSIMFGPRSWSDWSREGEEERRAGHDEFLRRELGDPPYVYAWGEILSVYDDKTGASVIIIRYS